MIATEEDVADGLQLMDLLMATWATSCLEQLPSLWTLLEFGYQPPPGLKMLCGGEHGCLQWAELLAWALG